MSDVEIVPTVRITFIIVVFVMVVPTDRDGAVDGVLDLRLRGGRADGPRTRRRRSGTTEPITTIDLPRFPPRHPAAAALARRTP